MTQAAAVAAAVAALEGEAPIDILVNNAAINKRGPLDSFSDDDWRALMAANLDGPFFVARAVIPGMKTRGRGKIINLCSLASDIGRPNIVPYATSKGGMRMLTRALAVELAPRGDRGRDGSGLRHVERGDLDAIAFARKLRGGCLEPAALAPVDDDAGRMNSALQDQIEARVVVRYNLKPSKRGRRVCLPRFAHLLLAHRKNAVSTAPVPAILALADGTLFRGQAIGASAACAGEVVFNTAMTGYQEILTDPSYAGQIVTLTYPHIGNTGVNAEDVESKRIFAAGLVIRDLPRVASSWRSTQDLSSYLRDAGVVGICGIDTRKLTRILRENGAQNGCVMAGARLSKEDDEEALRRARGAPSMAGLDLAKVVSCTAPYEWAGSTWALGVGYRQQAKPRFHILAYDYGIKHNILRRLAERGCRMTVVPAQTTAKDALARKPDGIFLSNGPGDPEPCDYAIGAIRKFLDVGIPTFGICLGHQLLGLAVGGKTLKMKFGHHGANHPVLDKDTGQVLITSQNHGFAVDASTLPPTARVTHVSLFDGTLQGFALTDKPAFCFQGHPEASPGPHDMTYLFDRFIRLMERRGS